MNEQPEPPSENRTVQMEFLRGKIFPYAPMKIPHTGTEETLKIIVKRQLSTYRIPVQGKF